MRSIFVVLIASAILLGLWLRVGRLGYESVWHDEAHSALVARSSPYEIVRASATADNNPPLYYLLLHWSTKLTRSDAEPWLRAPSVLFGIVGIVGTFLAAKELGGFIVGVWAAALVALSVFHIQYSREARMYSLLYATATMSMYQFLRLRTPGIGSALQWILWTIATLFAHTFGVFVVVAEHVCWAVLRVVTPDAVPRFRKWWSLNVGVVVLFAPWAFVTLQQHGRIGGVFWIGPPYLSQPLDILAALAGSFPVLVALLALACIGLVELIRRPRAITVALPPIAVSLVVIVWCAIPLLVPWLASYISFPIFIPRIAIAALAPLLIAAAIGLAALRPPIAMMAGAVVLVMCGRLAWQYTHALSKDDWRGVAAYIAQQTKPGELLLFHESNRRKGLRYYLPNPAADIAGFPDHVKTVQPTDIARLEPLVDGRPRVWLVLASSNDPKHLIEQALSTRFAMIDRREYRHVTVERFDAR